MDLQGMNLEVATLSGGIPIDLSSLFRFFTHDPGQSKRLAKCRGDLGWDLHRLHMFALVTWFVWIRDASSTKQKGTSQLNRKWITGR